MSSPGNPQTDPNQQPSLLNGTPPPATTDTTTGAPQNLSVVAPAPAAVPTPPAPVPSAAPVTAPYTPNSYGVTPQQTVAGQIKDIIASGSPLMQQAETSAKNTMAQRGLINSTQAITAGQSAVYDKALPIAQADAARYAAASDQTVKDQNTSMQFNAQAENASKIAQLQSNTTLTAQQMQDQTSAILQDSQSKLQTYLAQLSSNTTLTSQEMATEAQKAISSANNVSAQLIANINANTQLSVEDKQSEIQKVIAGMNNENAKTVQAMQATAALDQIKSKGGYDVQIEQLQEANKATLQTSAGASQMYTQMLSAMAGVLQNKDLTESQKSTAMNDMIQSLNDGLNVMGTISGIPGIQSLLSFSDGSAGSPSNNSSGSGDFTSGAYDQSGNYVGQGNGPYNSGGTFVG